MLAIGSKANAMVMELTPSFTLKARDLVKDTQVCTLETLSQCFEISGISLTIKSVDWSWTGAQVDSVQLV